MTEEKRQLRPRDRLKATHHVDQKDTADSERYAQAYYCRKPAILC